MARIIPEPSTAIAEFESGQRRRALRSASETSKRGSRPGEEEAAAVRAGASLLVRRDQHHARPAQGSARSPGAQLRRRRRTPSLAQADGRSRRARRGVDSAGARRIRRERASRIRTMSRRPSSCSPPPAIPNGIDVELWASHDPIIRRASPRRCRRYLAGGRHPREDRPARCVVDARSGAQGHRPISRSRTGAPTTRTPRTSSIRCCTARTRERAATSRSTRTRSSTRSSTQARREQDEAKRIALYTQADAIAFNDAPMIFLFFYNELYAVQPWIRGFKVPPIFNGQRWTDVTIEHETKQTVPDRFHRPPRSLLSIPTLFGVLVVVVPPALRRARRSGAGDGRRARRRRDDRAAEKGASPRRAAARAVRALRRRRRCAATSAIPTSPSARSSRTSASAFRRRCCSPARRCCSRRSSASRSACLSARNPGGWFDRLGLGIAYLGISLPGLLGRTDSDPDLRRDAASGCRRRATAASST